MQRIRENDPTIPGNFQPVAIVHPPGYVQAGGSIIVPICVSSGGSNADLVPSLQWAIETWNTLVPRYGNCNGCLTVEEVLSGTPLPGSTSDLPGTLLHELGHCAMGLDESNMPEIISEDARIYRTGACDHVSDGCCGDPSSFSASMNAEEIIDSNSVPGDRMDQHRNACPSIPLFARGEAVRERAGPAAVPAPCLSNTALIPCSTPPPPHECLVACCPDPPDCCPQCPGPECPTVPMQVQNISWYRRNDNNPFKIDSTAIDRLTFTRSLSFLPTGSNFAANANRLVGEGLGYHHTQNVMYSHATNGTKLLGLAADDVNMVRMGMTGADREIGGGDDYTVQLQLVQDCSQALIEVFYDQTVTSLAVCRGNVEEAFPQPGTVIHYRVVKAASRPRLQVAVDPSESWDRSIVVSFAGFEPGDFSEWSQVFP